MEFSEKIKERFCKDCNIPIKLYREPYFMERLQLYDSFFDTLSKWEVFKKELENYNCEQDYFEEYNQVKDKAILEIKESNAYQKFGQEDMKQFEIKNVGLTAKDIFKTINDNKTFLSIDIKKANFSALYHYNPEIFKKAASWETFIERFTKNQHIIQSKYIRQVILGNCNPKRHITYEKYLMDDILTEILGIISKEQVAFFSNDEIIIDLSELEHLKQNQIYSQIKKAADKKEIPLRVEYFTLHKIKGTNGYYKSIHKEEGGFQIEFKCIDNYIYPFILRKFLNQEITENDKVFSYEGYLAKLLQIPDIELEIKRL